MDGTEGVAEDGFAILPNKDDARESPGGETIQTSLKKSFLGGGSG